MPGRTGLDVAAAIGGDCHVVFITAYDQYAIAAFDAGAVDYLLKPVETERLAQTVERVKAKLASAPADLSQIVAELRARGQPARTRLKWIKAAVGKQIKLIPVDDVVYFQSDMKYTRVVLAQSEALIRTPLKDLLAELDPDRFWQIHRSTIVNVSALSGVLREDAERQFVLFKSRPDKLPDLAAVHAFVQADVTRRRKVRRSRETRSDDTFRRRRKCAPGLGRPGAGRGASSTNAERRAPPAAFRPTSTPSPAGT